MQTILKSTLLMALLGTVSGAQANLLLNGSFEAGASGVAQPPNYGTHLDPGTASASDVAGWTAIAPFGTTPSTSNNDVAWLGATSFADYGLRAQDGDDFLDLTGYSDASPYAGIQQTLTGLLSGGQYVLTFYVGTGAASTNGAYAGPASVSVLATSPAVLAVSQTFTAPASAEWTPEEYDFTAAASTVTISIYGASSAGGQYIGLDNVDLEAAAPVTLPPAGSVPEPAMLGLFGLGLVGLALARRRAPR